MKNKLKILIAMVLTVCTVISLVGCSTQEVKEEDNSFHIVSSFYPMHILCMNLTKGIDNVDEVSMSEPNMGCIHDHTFTTEDLKKVEGADVFVENGLGLEAFNDQIQKAYPDTAIIEASKNITEFAEGGSCSDDEDINGHVWTSVDNYILQVQYVSSELQRLNPSNKDKYAENETAYVGKLNKLKDDNATTLQGLEGKKVLILDETLPAFCEYLKMDYISIETDHEEESLSASDIKDTINKMNEDGIKAIFIGKDSDDTNARTIAEETGATIYEINTCMVGTVDEDAYINDMNENFQTIANLE